MATKTFVLHDESVNTYGFRMLTSGADLTEFRKNPVMLLNHDDWRLPIGRWENIRVEDGKILADHVFDLNDERGEEVAYKVDNDFIRMASIGAWPPLEVSDDPALKLPGQTYPTITKWVVREASIVTIGANHNALAFYDTEGNKIDLTDAGAVIKLVDTNTFKNMPFKKLLQLADTATPEEVTAAMRTIIFDRDRLKTENVTLSSRIDELNNAAKAKQKAEAVSLVDAAIKDGRLNASAKESYIKLFDTDFESAKATLEAIPGRKSVTSQIESGLGTSGAELADLQKKDWNTLDKEGKLVVLKDKYPDLYKEKFKVRYGCEPNV
jgi:hypothetical protein